MRGFRPRSHGRRHPEFRLPHRDPEPGVVQSKLGFSLNVDNDLAFAYEADLVVVSPTPREWWGRTDPRVLDVVRHAADRGAWLLSVCSGSFILAAAGVLDGRRATTHWMYAATMAEMYPSIDVDPDVLYVQDGRIITSAGTAAGLDACLHLLRQELGAEMTNTIARRMVVPPQRDGGQAQFILPSAPRSREPVALAGDRLDAGEPADGADGRPARDEGAHVAADFRASLQGRLRHDPCGLARPAAHHPRAAPARADRSGPGPHRLRMRVRIGLGPPAELLPRARHDADRIPGDVLLRDRDGRLRARTSRGRARVGAGAGRLPERRASSTRAPRFDNV